MDWDQTPKKEVEPWEIPDRPIVRPGETSNTSAQYQQFLDGEREAPPKPRRRSPARQPRPKQSSAVSEVLRQSFPPTRPPLHMPSWARCCCRWQRTA